MALEKDARRPPADSAFQQGGHGNPPADSHAPVTRGEDQGQERQRWRERLEAELQRCVEVLVREYRPQRILLFGSLAQGRVHEYSDIDLIVIKDTDKPFWDRIWEVLRLLKSTESLDILVYTPEEWQEIQTRLFFEKEVLPKSKVLYDASG